VEEPRSLERERKVTNRGRRVAIDEAVIPIPGSTVDPAYIRGSYWAGERIDAQIETSTLAKRKSVVSVSW